MEANTAPIAPSATETGSASSAAPGTPQKPLQSLADFAQLAALSLREQMGEGAQANTNSASGTPPTEPPGGELAGATATEQTTAGNASTQPAEAGTTNGEPAEAGTANEESDQSGWTEGEKRMHAVMQKEREESKKARSELRELRKELDALKNKTTGNDLPGQTPPAEPVNGSAPGVSPVPAPGAMPGARLADCHTFEAVDARAMQAAKAEALALNLQMTLARKGREAVIPVLIKEGLKDIGGTPVNEASEEQIGDLLGAIYEHEHLVAQEAAPRKQFLVAQAQSFQEAMTLVPELQKPGSDRRKAFNAILSREPWILNAGARWPVIAAKQLLGDEQTRTATGNAEGRMQKAERQTASADQTPPIPTRPAPAAPRLSAAALPRKSEADETSAALASGKANMQDIYRYAATAVRKAL